jgi:hypothetical protein
LRDRTKQNVKIRRLPTTTHRDEVTRCTDIRDDLLAPFSRRVKLQDPEASAQRTADTYQRVQEIITNGPGRSFGSRWIMTHLRRKYGYHARLTDIQEALQALDPEGVASRTPGIESAVAEGVPADQVKFEDCYIFGSSWRKSGGYTSMVS